MSTLGEIRAAIATLHRAVPDIGVVHEYERYTRDEAKFREQYVVEIDGQKQVRGWWWRRAATEEKQITLGTTLNVHTWECRGYLALNDAQASENTFDELVEAFRDAVRADPTLGGVCEANPLLDGDGTDGVQVLDAGPVIFSGVLCHSAVLQLRTWSYL
ncbi:hypothetical protein [Ramlibacter sp.]|uniref:hypothetical protein n=1 Tax=Ramlibacter sp. TaxID=1917967 RepID=UPI003D112A53